MAEVITQKKFIFNSKNVGLQQFLSYGNKVVIKTSNKIILIKEHWLRSHKNV